MTALDLSSYVGLAALCLLTANLLLGLLLSVRHSPWRQWPHRRFNYFVWHNWSGYIALAKRCGARRRPGGAGRRPLWDAGSPRHRLRRGSPHMRGRTAHLTALGALLLALPAHLPGQEPQDSSDLRYRWSEKVDTALAGQLAFPTSVIEMLTSWKPPEVGPKDADAPRRGRELHVYRLAGWIRRAKQNDDGDVHLSLTATPDGSEDSCVVAEIPAERYGAVYRRARADLLPIVEGTQIKKSGRLAPPVAVVVTGAAFYDGKHLQRPKGHGKHKQAEEAHSHGDCNVSPSALWEIHPVYKVEQP